MRAFSSGAHVPLIRGAQSVHMDESSRARLESLRDPALPALQELLQHGSELWRAAGGAEEARVRPLQVRWQLGHSVTVRYDASGEGDESLPLSGFVAHVGTRPEADVTLLRSDLGEVSLWRLAEDPWLPGLRVALNPESVRGMLATLGVARGPVALRLRAYRPGRRAVVEVQTGVFRCFVKVVRPQRIAPLQRRHAAIAGRLPVPASHGWSSELGLVVLEARQGTTLREALASGQPVPPVDEVRHLLDRLPKLEGGGVARSQVQAGVDQLPLVRQLAPEAARALDQFDLAALVGPSRRSRTVHGDLHEAQLLVEEGRLSGLLDIDTAGLGDPRDDWATFLGHLVVRVQESEGAERERIRVYGREVAEVLQAIAEGADAWREASARVAAVILGLGTSAFTALAPNWAELVDGRVGLAVSWLRGEGPARLDEGIASVLTDEKRLMALSPGTHPTGPI